MLKPSSVSVRFVPGDSAPDTLSPPGETLSDVLEERGMTQADLAERTGLSRKTINLIIKGHAPITPETALHLERVLGTPARFWNAREGRYREAVSRRQEAESLRRHADWVRRFPYREMARLGLVESVDGRSADALVRRGRALLRFFGVASPEQWTQVWLKPSAVFRKALTFTSDPEPVSVWLRYGERVAQEQRATRPFDEKRFRVALVEIRGLTRQPPVVFLDRIVTLCADACVAVVLTPPFPRARIAGATQWLRPDLALLQLSVRYRTNDSFWFTFFHEAAHILLHGKRDVFLEGSEDRSTAHEEDEADRWAFNFLIPEARMRDFLARGDLSRGAVQQLADRLGIAPGVVVGLLQHRKIISLTRHNRLKERLGDAFRAEAPQRGLGDPISRLEP